MNIPNEKEWKNCEVFNLHKDMCIIYFLYDMSDEIIYIGRTRDFFRECIIINQIKRKCIKFDIL
jgi:hypothetical protein